jgi:hypothetical protein
MNGIQSLMQSAPTSPQPTQAPAMPAQNDPRMAAAMQRGRKTTCLSPCKEFVDKNDFAQKSHSVITVRRWTSCNGPNTS